MNRSVPAAAPTLVLVLAVAAVLVLAGCAAPIADSSPTPNAGTGDGESADAGLDVRTGSLPIDGNETLDRTAAMLGVPIDPPVVHVDDSSAGGASGVRDPSSFDALVGMPFPDGNDVSDELTVGGAASPFAAVYVAPADDSSAAEIEQVLAHELVHVAQFQHRAPQEVRAGIPEAHRTTRDAELVVTSMTEGGAVYGSSAYTERYDLPIDPESEILERLYPDASVGTKLVWGPYHYGAQYIDSVATDPESHWAVYEEPPATMRQVLHGESGDGTGTGTGALEPFEATLASDAGGDTGDWNRAGSETMGEFVVRLVLETELTAETSADAASGWVYDRQLRVANADESLDGHAWSVRFEDAANASTYASALTSYLDARADSSERAGNASTTTTSSGVVNATWYTDDYAFAVAAPDERTVTLLGGPEAFVEAASVDVTADADVSLSVSDAREETATATVRSVAAPDLDPGPDPVVGAIAAQTPTNGMPAPERGSR
ncbi:hypothetical protein [Halomontanus rarus]|uniref:hypothetical protein n=1 Tax=Halomontanus rarus TaxID=3034020 RepID=UPI0023E77862|nr:hypothetical protein [Halovivax sp. TS33]